MRTAVVVRHAQGIVIQYRLARRCRMTRAYSFKRALYISQNAGPVKRWMRAHGWKVWET